MSLLAKIHVTIVDLIKDRNETGNRVIQYCNFLLLPQQHGTLAVLRPTLVGLYGCLLAISDKGIFKPLTMDSNDWTEWYNRADERSREAKVENPETGAVSFGTFLKSLLAESLSKIPQALKDFLLKIPLGNFLLWITPGEAEVTSTFLERVFFIRSVFFIPLFGILWPLNILALSWSIIAIETTIAWNSIIGVYDIRSTGQLIPFVVGLGGLLKVLIGLWKKRYNHDPESKETAESQNSPPQSDEITTQAQMFPKSNGNATPEQIPLDSDGVATQPQVSPKPDGSTALEQAFPESSVTAAQAHVEGPLSDEEHLATSAQERPSSGPVKFQLPEEKHFRP